MLGSQELRSSLVLIDSPVPPPPRDPGPPKVVGSERGGASFANVFRNSVFLRSLVDLDVGSMFNIIVEQKRTTIS